MTGARHTPARIYQPDFFSIASLDPKYRGSRIGTSTGATNTAWIANLAVFVPIQIDSYCTIYEWWWSNGTLTTAHNVDFGLYREDFTKIQTLGSSTGTTTASVLCNTGDGTTPAWTNLNVAPGDYFMAFADNSTRNILTMIDAAGVVQADGCFEQSSSSFPLPATATPVLYNRAFLPVFGMHLSTVVP